MKITDPTVLASGMSARPCKTGFVAVALEPEADPVAMTPAVLAAEEAALPGWRFRKEYRLDFTAQAGMPVFEGVWLDAQKETVHNPTWRLAWDRETNTVAEVEGTAGEIRAWLKPSAVQDDVYNVIPDGTVRACGIGVDVGEGVGASDSTIQVFFADNREQAAEFASNTIKPADLGRLAVALAVYFNNASICCVRKMHGITVLRSIMEDCRYRRVWRPKANLLTREDWNPASFGWPGGESSSPYLFGAWMDGIQHQRTILHSQTTLDQHRQYIYDSSGRITHQARADLPPEVRERHGDLVVACALAYRACLDVRPTVPSNEERRPVPPQTVNWRAF